jgi:hypothetical protein
MFLEPRSADAEPRAALRLARAVKDRQPVGVLSPRRPVREGEVVHAWTRVENMQGQLIEHVWLREETVIARHWLRIDSNSCRTWSRRRMSYQPKYPAGGSVWTVEVRTAAGDVLASASFIVQGPCARTHDCERD